jgi:hypothetical protein
MKRLRERWPSRRFAVMQSPETARDLAMEVRSIVGKGLRPSELARGLGFRVKASRDPSGELEALCLPMKSGGFYFPYFLPAIEDKHRPLLGRWVKRQMPQDPRKGLDLIVELVLGHELGHTFFYSWDPARSVMPYRLLPPFRGHPDQEREELFCDEFALALMRPDLERSEIWLLSQACAIRGKT